MIGEGPRADSSATVEAVSIPMDAPQAPPPPAAAPGAGDGVRPCRGPHRALRRCDRPRRDEDPRRQLLGVVGRAIPVLHLHGRLGWFLSRSRPGTVVDMQVDNYNAQWGTPIIMWPDDRKDASSYEGTEVINVLWDQLREALARARQVAVLGHSLHDPFLVSALRTVPSDHVLVMVFDDDDDRRRKAEEQRITDLLGAVAVLPVRFAANVQGLEGLQATLRGIA